MTATLPRPVHAARPGLPGDHRTDGLRCPCDPWQLADLNEPGRIVYVHRPIITDSPDIHTHVTDGGKVH